MQFFKFVLVGISNTIVNLIVLYIFTDIFKVHYMISAIIAFFVAVNNSFVLNKIWTFKENNLDKSKTKYLKFIIISILALGINLLILYITTEIFKIYYLISQIIAIGISLWVNFLGNKIWTFKE